MQKGVAMLKVMKYEFRKGLAMKGIMLGVLFALAVLYTFSLMMSGADSTGSFVGMTVFLTVVVCLFAYFFVAFENVFSLYQEINSDRGYMLFMTPNSSYKIIAAKVLTGLIQMIVMILIFLLVLYYYVFAASAYFEGPYFMSPMRIFSTLILEDPEMLTLRIIFYIGLMWTFGLLFMMVAGSLSVVLTSFVNTTSKALNVIINFVVFVLIKFAGDFVAMKVAQAANLEEFNIMVPGSEYKIIGGVQYNFDGALQEVLEAMRALSWIEVGVYAAMTVIVYLLASWVLDKKVNL